VRGGRVVKGSCDDDEEDEDDVDEVEVEVDDEDPGLCGEGEGGCARMCAWCG
jgi:hypothetical protein